MKAIPTAEQREFASSLRALLSAESPVPLVRALNEPDADRRTPTLWKALTDAGVLGLAIAEEYGGSGGSLDDLAVFYTEAGRALCPTTDAQQRSRGARDRPARLARTSRPPGCRPWRAARLAAPRRCGAPATPPSCRPCCVPNPCRRNGG